mgnify:CR=1 FL=1
MKNSILNLSGVQELKKHELLSVKGSWNCNACYSNNGGMYNNLDPACQGCGLPEMH